MRDRPIAEMDMGKQGRIVEGLLLIAVLPTKQRQKAPDGGRYQEFFPRQILNIKKALRRRA